MVMVGLLVVGGFWWYRSVGSVTQTPSVPLATATSPETSFVKSIWSATLSGNVTGIAVGDVDGRGWKLVVADSAGRLTLLDEQGTFRGALAGGHRFALGDLNGDGKSEAVCADMRTGIRAVNEQNVTLWKYQLGFFEGPDSVAVRDLSGDGRPETIIGYNGFTGLHVLDSRGRLKWKYTGIGNVWNVATGKVMGDGKVYVLATEASGQINVLDASGKVVAQFRPGGAYCAQVYSADLTGDGIDEVLAVGTPMNAAAQQVLYCTNGTGLVTWQVPLAGEDHEVTRQLVATGDFNGDGASEVVALTADGSLRMVERNGKLRFSQSLGSRLSGVCALPKSPNGRQRFVVGVGNQAVCYEETARVPAKAPSSSTTSPRKN